MKRIAFVISTIICALLLSSSRQHQALTIPDIYFVKNAVEYNPVIAQQYPYCMYPDCYDKIVKIMQENPEMGRLELRGHQGKDEKTPKLSAARMHKVKEELVKRGLSEERIVMTDRKTADSYIGPEGMSEEEKVTRNYRVSLNLPDVKKTDRID